MTLFGVPLQAVWPGVVIVAWLVLNIWVLPRLGVRT